MLFSARTLFLSLVAVCCFSAYSVAAPIVLFDESHGQQFLIGKNGPLDLSELAELYQVNDISVISRSDATCWFFPAPFYRLLTVRLQM
ncbi:MAG: hypothetical protein JRC99_13655 [Deltaproteobacteria bacterium]|nr:hypothetical protein [Deltaproteobacteria bacterium]